MKPISVDDLMADMNKMLKPAPTKTKKSYWIKDDKSCTVMRVELDQLLGWRTGWLPRPNFLTHFDRWWLVTLWIKGYIRTIWVINENVLEPGWFSAMPYRTTVDHRYIMSGRSA